jgi:hypothetical protein
VEGKYCSALLCALAGTSISRIFLIFIGDAAKPKTDKRLEFPARRVLKEEFSQSLLNE